VYEAAEAVAALDVALGRRFELWRCGRLECESAVRALAGVVLDVDAKDSFEVAAADDQEVVEAFGPDGADEPLGVGVRLRRANGRVHDRRVDAARPSRR
jgi:hypothetical protein